jgi:hypothetical protein
MVTINFNWHPSYYTPRTERYFPLSPRVLIVTWRRIDNNSLLRRSQGVYIVENPAGTPAYAGQAQSFRGRFNSRSNSLHELRLTAAVMPNHRVRTAGITISPSTSHNQGVKLAAAEQWLVRILYLRDQGLTLNALQNINLTDQFNAPAGGLTINNIGNCPAYLNATYVYAPNAPI